MDFSNFHEGDWQNFLYLVVILCVLLNSLANKKDLGIKQATKYLVVWSVIALVAVLIYSYRYQFFEIKNRVVTELTPSTPSINNLGQIVIKASQDGHFYLDTKINGIAVRFMIDTGASDTTLNKNDAQRIGINLNDLIFNRVYQTANGKSLGAAVQLDEFEIGTMKFQNVGATVNSADMGTSLLGMNFLKQLKKYEFYEDKLIISVE